MWLTCQSGSFWWAAVSVLACLSAGLCHRRFAVLQSLQTTYSNLSVTYKRRSRFMKAYRVNVLKCAVEMFCSWSFGVAEMLCSRSFSMHDL